MNPLSELQSWYSHNCRNEWEEEYGIRIETLDNPGWAVFIDLIGTALEKIEFLEVDENRSEADWVVCRVREKKFEGFGGPCNLTEILDIFFKWQQSTES